MNFIIIIAGCLNLTLGLWVWLSNKYKKLNNLFLMFSLATTIVCIFDFIFRFYPTGSIVKWSYAFASILPNIAVLWLYELCEIKLSKVKTFLILLPGIFFFLVSASTNFIIREVYFLTFLGYRGNFGLLFPYYSTYIFVFSIVIIWELYERQLKTSNALKRLQLRYILVGLLLYSLSGSIFSLLLPSFFHIYDLTLLDALSSLFFVGFSSYAILKHHLFNIKVVATEIFVFFISVTLLIDSLLSKNLSEFVLKFFLFLGVSFLGGLLIRGVLGEIKSKDRIKELADNLGSANKELSLANRELKKLDKTKSEFLSIASHQLRTPIAAIRGLSAMLVDGDFGKLSIEQDDALKKILMSCGRMVHLIDNLLNISRMESGRMKFNFEEADIKNMAKEVVEELRPIAEQKGLHINFESQGEIPKLMLDPEKMRQVLINFIDNSIKYTEKGDVDVSLKIIKQKELREMISRSSQYPSNKLNMHNKNDNYVVFSVKDKGMGISEDDQYSLFKKFVRGNGMSTVNTNGSGLGLYVCRKMIEAHKGFIWTESEGEGQGSKFCFALKAGKL